MLQQLDALSFFPTFRNKVQRNEQKILWIGLVISGVFFLHNIYVCFSQTHPMVDVNVYWQAARQLDHGQPIYGMNFFTGYDYLPFTYPPFAALIFSIFGFLPFELIKILSFVLNISFVVGCTIMILKRYGLWNKSNSILRLITLSLAASDLMPLASTFDFGQINLLLLLLVLCDFRINNNPSLQGIFTGLAASIKLTPAIFVFYFIMKKDWRGLSRMVITAVLATGITWICLPQDSAHFWFHLTQDTGNVGAIDYSSNQSLLGAVARIFHIGGSLVLAKPTTFLWLALVIITLVATCITIRYFFSLGWDHEAVLITGCAGLLCSPISWAHHWVWCFPLACALVYRTWTICNNPRTDKLFTGVAIISVLFLATFWFWSPVSMPGARDWVQHRSLTDHILVNAYIIVGIICIFALIKLAAFYKKHLLYSDPILDESDRLDTVSA